MPDAGDRLLQAWRGEIEAGAVYELIARREQDPERAEILRRMAAAESGHRGRLEERLRELGIPVPDPGAGQALALAAPAGAARADRPPARRARGRRDGRGRRPLPAPDRRRGDRPAPARDPPRRALALDLAVNEMLAGPPAGAAGAGPRRRAPGAARPHPRAVRSWHESGSGWISGAIYGANDGLAAVFGIVTGVSGATGGSSFVLTAGVAGAVASALSMATGAFLAERSELEVAAANVEHERQEIAEHPEEEKEELSLFYQLKGLDQQTADALADEQAEGSRRDAAPAHRSRSSAARKAAGNPVESAVAAGISTGVGAIIPVIPFFFLTGGVAIVLAGIVSLVAHFVVGAAKSLFTLRSWWASGLEMTLAGVLVGGVTYAIGLAFA